MLNTKYIFIVLVLLFKIVAVQAESYLSWEELEKRVKSENIDLKALGHIRCFFEKHDKTVFQKKMSESIELENRCQDGAQITIDSKRVFALIDYTKPSNQKRMHLIDRKTGKISSMAVAHGRYEASFVNMKLSHNKNSIFHARYFSNEFNSNAPSSGFYVAGQEYEGKFGRSLILHGLEEGINDNACERSVVIHKHVMMTDNNAFVLSSGCPMVSKNQIDHVINLLKSPEDVDGKIKSNGSVVFIYGPREKRWDSLSCDGNFVF